MRRRIFEIIEVTEDQNVLSKIYDFFMIVVILISIVPLVFKTKYSIFSYIENISVAIFLIDYALRLITADFKFTNKKVSSFLIYPFTPMAIIDLVSILPTLLGFNGSLRLLRLFRLFRSFRVFRIFKLIRYSQNVKLIANVFKKQKEPLVSVLVLAVGYIIISALIVFNVEPDIFKNFFEAIYWATVSLTTKGYGDIYPITVLGRSFTIISSLFGVAIVALPAGIITAGYMTELSSYREDKVDK